jgi:hypothetical protein
MNMSYPTSTAASHSGHLDFETLFGDKMPKETFLWSFPVLSDKLQEYPQLKVSIFWDITRCSPLKAGSD